MEPILLSIATFISTFFGGLFGIKYREKLHFIISFTAGVLISVAFFDIIPEMVEIVEANGLSITMAMMAIVLGFLAIHIIEKLAVIHTGHEDVYADHKHPLVGKIGASGLIFHSMLDGIGIGLGFHVSPHVGLLIAIAVIAHDFCDGLNTVSLMLVNKNTTKKAKAFLFADALAPVIGLLLTFLFTIPQWALVIYLGFFAGFLLYLGASDLLPEAHRKNSSYKLIGLTLLGVLFIFIVTRFV
jgi:zinc transporter ZupT